ncbi:Phage head maturation protease [Mycobacterium numidiamassiliense]|uniref:Phage head maturation protease n=1 Tax=Mycobacterium numidiamassiliense TaxID=1841861 RepID=A0A2U3PIP8_9MYCO|nr:HK97 family phage prohead protease [Mycobacterium numidiamassiliense]SPM43599.1 Phage head maturation protease [Mycobacterium numidiamassiliense]
MTREYRADRENLVGVRECRSWAEDFTFRTIKATGDHILEGYAATFDPYDYGGGPNAGGWVEQIDKRAFDATLATQPDVMLLINHTGLPLARTKSGNLKLSRDTHGLKVWARLDKSDPDVMRLLPKMRRRDVDEMSFAFRVTEQDWDADYTHRTIRALTLQKGDVSVVNYGANPGTQAEIRRAANASAVRRNPELFRRRYETAHTVGAAIAYLQAVMR